MEELTILEYYGIYLAFSLTLANIIIFTRSHYEQEVYKVIREETDFKYYFYLTKDAYIKLIVAVVFTPVTLLLIILYYIFKYIGKIIEKKAKKKIDSYKDKDDNYDSFNKY